MVAVAGWGGAEKEIDYFKKNTSKRRRSIEGYVWVSDWAFGLPNFSGRVIRVIQNSGNRKCYPILTLKNHYPTIRVPAISGSGSGIPDIPEVLRFATARRRCSFSPPDRCAAAGGEGGAAALATRDRRGREVERER